MIQEAFRELATRALREAQTAGELPAAGVLQVVVEQPQRPEHGDVATPLALGLARAMRLPPRRIAEALAARMPLGDMLESVEVAGPGYINGRVAPAWLAAQVERVVAAGPGFADLRLGAGRRANVEFVSANPTGPLTVGHGRNVVLGDTLARVLAAAGYAVTREYYFNDGGLQMKNLAESVRLRAMQELGAAVDLPTGYYQGDYIRDIAGELIAEHGPSVVERDWEFFRDRAVERIFADIRQTQARLGVTFDVYTNERGFFDPARPGSVWDVVERLRAAGVTYEADEATWFRATAFGAPKDRVLLRSAAASMFAALRAAQARLGAPVERSPNEVAQSIAFYDRGADDNLWLALERMRDEGLVYEADGVTWLRATRYGAASDEPIWAADRRPDPTYRLPDIAYHIDKLERGFDLAADVLGADHIAQFPDIRAALEALGYDADRVRVLSYQFVTLLRGGQVVKMSTRRAEYVTLDELVDEVGADAVRFFMLMRSADAPIEFDLDLAKRESDENPVFYVQYAHARCCAILAKARAEDRRSVPGAVGDTTAPCEHPAEIALAKAILRLGDVLRQCSESLELHHLTFYARDLATALSGFYEKCTVLVPDPGRRAARLRLVDAARIALARALDLCGVSAPARMESSPYRAARANNE